MIKKKHNPFAYFYRQIQIIQKDQQVAQDSIVITGFPYDEGTRLNNGRIGAEKGSKFFRENLNSAEYPELQLKIQIKDSQDIESDLSLENAHNQQSQKIQNYLSQGCCVFSMGGSNDQSYPNVLALINQFKKKIGVINIDAHMDVRPLIDGKQAHSGSPFRLMIENQIFKQTNSKFVNFANQGAQCSYDHYQYMIDNGHKVIWLNKDIRRTNLHNFQTQAGQLFNEVIQEFINENCEYIFVSFDVDSIDSAYCPGVSAPSVIGGLTEEEAFEIMKISGQTKQVKLVDFSEFNPAVEKIETPKLLAKMFYIFCEQYNNRF